MARLTDAIKHLLIINILFFVATQLYSNQMYHLFSMWFPKNDNFQVWQVITHMFMHGSVMHIVANMFVLWMFGSPLEKMWGRNKFLFFYFSAGLGALLLQTGANYYFFSQSLDVLVHAGAVKTEIIDTLIEGQYNTGWYDLTSQDVVDNMLSEFNGRMLGASGATAGIMVAFAFMFPNMELMLMFLPVPIKAKYFVPLYFIGDFYYGFSNAGDGIAHFAHIGGALLGFIMMWYWKKNQFNGNRWN
ncbi:rhomboid family intramembrane serine protease [uncultured Maribacter sp.]|uniref:rhomboid family intramembrane serine protease n=1 Tax=uncultured Maribacter sp. TaxID=431308 RepID=UPI00262E27F0|nr:rhomboid family intramembrane serine protease [uncultured Maribacter sp.]